MGEVMDGEIRLIEAFWQQVHRDLKHEGPEKREEVYEWMTTPFFERWVGISGHVNPDLVREELQ